MRRSVPFALCLGVLACGGGRELSLGGVPLTGSGGGGTGGGSSGSGGMAAAAGSGGASGAAAGAPGSGGGAPVCDEPAGPLADTLLPELVGYAAGTTGGRDGCVVRVTNLGDSGAGSLRAALEQPDPAWIVFADGVDGRIELQTDLVVTSDKTIDGRGHAITLANEGLLIGLTRNVIVTNLTFEGDPSSTDEDADAIRISQDSQQIWIHHVAISDYADEHVEISRGAGNVTISWSYFAPGENTNSHPLLFGDRAASEDRGMFVTMHHNWFDGTASYHPRLRWGVVHSYNNWFLRWNDYASGSSLEGHLYSENNVYTPASSEEATIVQVVDDEAPGFLRSLGDLPEQGDLPDGEQAVIVQAEPPAGVAFLLPTYPYTSDPAEAVKELVQQGAGPRPQP